jgi:iron complex transport system permease protein
MSNPRGLFKYFSLGVERGKVLGLLFCAFACTLLGLSHGALEIDLVAVILGSSPDVQSVVFNEIRSPRVFLAGFVGASLALSGATLQGLFRNPLADPGLIGVSSGAALGAVAMIVWGSQLDLPSQILPYALPVSAVIGAFVVTIFLFYFAAFFGGFNIIMLLLVGIAVNAFATVGIGLFQFLADDGQLRSLVFWTMGSFGRASWSSLLPAAVMMTLGAVFLLAQKRNLDILQLGDAEAGHLGVDVNSVKKLTILGSALAVGAGVALSGIVGFVGLVVPHLVRLLIGARHQFLLPGCIGLGASITILADLLSRTIIVPAELPVSLVTSAIGAPFFLYLISRMRVI